MYCIHCGVQLAQVQTTCPLCGTKMILPEGYQPDVPLYPENRYPKEEKRQLWPQGIIAAAFFLPMLISIICDYQMGSAISWSGYVVGALLVAYVAIGLPTWFRRPNPVIFAPCIFLAAASSPGFRSGWYCLANRRYAFLTSSSEAPGLRPNTL